MWGGGERNEGTSYEEEAGKASCFGARRLIWGNMSRRSAVAGGSACKARILEERPKVRLVRVKQERSSLDDVRRGECGWVSGLSRWSWGSKAQRSRVCMRGGRRTGSRRQGGTTSIEKPGISLGRDAASLSSSGNPCSCLLERMAEVVVGKGKVATTLRYPLQMKRFAVMPPRKGEMEGTEYLILAL